MSGTTTRDVVARRTLDAPPEEAWRAWSEPSGVHVVTLVPLPDGRTEVTVTEHGYLTDEARDLSLAGLEQCLDKMVAMFAAG